jgi:hypothetical protein
MTWSFNSIISALWSAAAMLPPCLDYSEWIGFDHIKTQYEGASMACALQVDFRR